MFLRPSSAFSCVICMGLPLALGACGKSEAVAPPPPDVTVTHPAAMDVRPSIDLTGVVAASKTVDLVARVSGFLRAKDFADGDHVRRGQRLFAIESSDYAAQMTIAGAREAQARQELARQNRLLAQDATAKTDVEAAQSSMQQAAGNAKIARTNLGYTSIRAPFDGWIGASQVDPGNYVGGAGMPTKLATLQQLSPIYINFTLGEREVLSLIAAMRAKGDTMGRNLNGYPVEIGLTSENGTPHHGTLNFSSKSIDPATGSLQARAIITQNTNYALIPGLFARVHIDLGQPVRAMTLPQRLIQSDELGDYVYVVDGEGRAARRNIQTGRNFGQTREVTGGLSAGDNVITEGLANVRGGQKVRAHPAPAGGAA